MMMNKQKLAITSFSVMVNARNPWAVAYSLSSDRESFVIDAGFFPGRCSGSAFT